MSAYRQQGRCQDCSAEFTLHAATQRFVGHWVPTGEVELDICPECGSYNVQDTSIVLSTDDALDDTCTVIFRLSREQLQDNSFLYALACRTEGWKGVEILQVQLPDSSYEKTAEREG